MLYIQRPMARSKQINFRLPLEHEPLLLRAVGEYGTAAAAIVAGLHALDRSAPGRRAPESAVHDVASDSPDASYFTVGNVAEAFGRSPGTVRKWVRDGLAHGRGEGQGQEVDIASIRLPRTMAAEWLVVKSATLRKYAEQGRVEPDDDGLYLFGSSSCRSVRPSLAGTSVSANAAARGART